MKKRLLALLLLLTLLVSNALPSVAAAANKADKTQATTTKHNEHGTTPFSEITYKKPDFVALDKKLNQLSSLLKKKNQEKKIDKLVEDIDAALTEAVTMLRYLKLIYSKDVTKTDIVAEMNDITTEYYSYLLKYSNVCIQILESSYGDNFKKDMTEEEIEEIYKTQKTLTPEYIKLSSESTRLYAEYVKARNMTIDVNGTAMTLDQIPLSSTLTQEEIVKYSHQLYLSQNEAAGSVYLKLIEVYKQQAKLEGFEDVIDYFYDSYDRDYSKVDVKRFSTYVKETIVPLYFDLYNSFTQDELVLLQSTPSGLKQLDPVFTEYFKAINPQMLEAYQYLLRYDLCDSDISETKEPITYTTYLNSLNQPYIHINSTGSYTDVQAFIHEFGHFYAYYRHGDDLSMNLDIFEIHSQANELLFSPYFSIYGDAYQPIMKYQLLNMLGTIISGCLHDEFQQYVYSHDVTSVKELNEIFFNLESQYGLVDPNSGFTEDMSWIMVPHTFQMPFYYISYAMSAVPALDIYCQSLTDREGAIKSYNKIMYYGTDYSFISTLIRSRVGSPFSERTINEITNTLRNMFGLKVNVTKQAPAA